MPKSAKNAAARGDAPWFSPSALCYLSEIAAEFRRIVANVETKAERSILYPVHLQRLSPARIIALCPTVSRMPVSRRHATGINLCADFAMILPQPVLRMEPIHNIRQDPATVKELLTLREPSLKPNHSEKSADAHASARLDFRLCDERTWCGWSDSNRHSLRKQSLSLSRLPFRHTRTFHRPDGSPRRVRNGAAMQRLHMTAI